MELPRTPSFDLSGKRALVTGAGRGLGLAAAAALSDAGAAVTLAARSFDEVSEAADLLNRRGGLAEALRLDVSDVEAVDDALSRHLKAGEVFDILVNNAGTNRPGPFVDVTVEDFDAVFGLNVRGAFFAAQCVAKKLIDAGRPGSIINISSQMGHVGAPLRTVYCASKHAMEGMTKAMAVELGGKRIRVNAICPTFIETPLTRGFFQDEAFREDVLKRIKLGRLGRVEDVMGAVLYLAGDAASLVTGSSLLVDGGWTAE